MTVNWKQAEQAIWRFVNDYENLSASEQSEIDTFLDRISNCKEILDKKRQYAKRKQQEAKAEQARKRRELRKQMIPVWCEKHLKPGMYVKVKAKNSTERCIESVQLGDKRWNRIGSLKARHGHFTRPQKRQEENFEPTWIPGAYITDHMFDKVTAVMTDRDERGRAGWTPIMTLVEKDIDNKSET